MKKQNEPDGFDKAKAKAASLEHDPVETEKLTEKATRKAKKSKRALKKVWEDIQGFIRMVNAWRTGSYTAIPWKTMMLIIASLIYFVNPFDAILDMIPFVGFIDDIAVIGFVANSVRADVQKFLAWESQNLDGAENKEESVAREIAIE